MRYQGGKSRISKQIAEMILTITSKIEGGGGRNLCKFILW